MTSDRLIAGRYRLADPIGSGAMGVVWRASDVRLRRTVAVKQLLLAPGLTKAQALEAKMRAMREGRIAARLHHQNAVTVFDVAEEDGQPWLVMEYVDAQSLAALMRDKGPLEPREVARIGAKVAAALAAAHDAGIVHRDVKPANILVADNGTVKITDFGISRAVGDVTVTSTGFLAGTPAYLSPEIARGEDPEPSSDVFALGSTLYAAVEGAPPFGEGDNPLAVLHSVVSAKVPEPKRAESLGPVLMSLLAADSADRPTMREAQQALEAVADGRPAALVPAATKVLPQPGADAAATTVLSAPEQTPAAPAPAGAASTARTPAPQPKPGPLRDRRIWAAAAAAVLVLAVIIGLVATSGSDDNHSTAAGNGTTSAPEQPSATAFAPPGAATPDAPGGSSANGAGGSASLGSPVPNGQTPPPAPSGAPAPGTSGTRTPPSGTSAPYGPAQPADVASFISGYYGMLPGNTSGAWAELAPSYQSQTGGYAQYSNFWSTVSSVRVGGVTQSGPGRAVAALTYTLKNGTVTSESRWFTVDTATGRMLITASGT
ncbi:Serine/threonine-protein kinase PknB [Nocardia cerradoensis]|uniref:non-specific serine/threonine protein kinase n=1 Tax=Nocardia cerradoensis TaxID=85688 RepID=A0A231H282_9NOCA|nr:serine/threonine-protein kinase [Nocardia cerradoensis]OXR42953.1 Serine/threonine-protein kinase PknB [Nocardia cerradoensis]